MSRLFIYYSYTGNGDAVARRMAELGCDVRAVKRKKPMPSSFFLGMMTGGFLAGVKHKDALSDFDSDFSGYDGIVVGSPVWNGRISSPVNTVLAALPPDKPLAFVLYAGSGLAPAAQKRIAAEYPSARCLILKEPKKYPGELDKLGEYV